MTWLYITNSAGMLCALSMVDIQKADSSNLEVITRSRFNVEKSCVGII